MDKVIENKEFLKKTYSNNDLQRLYDKDYFQGRGRDNLWERRADFIIEKFNPCRVLDIGCATGELVKHLNKKGIDTYGIDGSDYAINNCDPEIRDKIFKVNFNCDEFQFPDNHFDLITSFYSVEHIHDIDFFGKEILRTLKPHGIAWFLTPNLDESGRTEVDVFTNKYEDWKKIFENLGFTVDKFSPHGMLTLRGKLHKYRLYILPNFLQNIIKKIAYDIANAKYMKDTSFIIKNNP